MPARRRSSSPRANVAPSSLPLWAAACFFVSGAAGLLYEVTWAKQLSYVLGNSLHAVATVTAAFLGGLALGARWLGPALGQRRDGVRVYAMLELGIAVLGVASIPVLRGLDPVMGFAFRALGGEGAAFGLARFLILSVLLVPPAALMGATLPALVSSLEPDRVGPVMARLYALNTFGAVAGTVAAGFVLIPTLGLMSTTWLAAALNIAVGACAFAVARGRGTAPARTGVTAAVDAPSPATLEGAARRTFQILFLLSGVSALAFQIAWVRVFTLVFGSSVYSFSAVLGVYLLGLAIGSAIASLSLRRGASLTGFGGLQLVLGASAALQWFAISRLPQWTYDLVARSGSSWSTLVVGEAGLLVGFLLVPCVLLGAAFPIATRLLQRGDTASAVGSAYGINAIGTIVGSLAAGFVAIPAFGVRSTHLAAVLLSAVVGAVAVGLAIRRRELSSATALAVGGLCVAIGITVVAAPAWEPALMSSGIYRPIQARNIARAATAAATAEDPSVVRRAVENDSVLYYAEGMNGSVLVGTDGRDRWLRVGGKIDASTGRDMETQVMLGLIPGACADSGSRTLVVGLGAGLTAEGVLAAGMGRTDVVELEPRVVEASRFFHAAGEHPLDDPRARLVIGDARTHLAHSRDRYGLIVSEPSNPWIAGVNNLFTVDFYRLARSRLEPGGVYCQWVQLYELSPATLASMVASFLEVFPDGHAYAMCRNADLLLVATPPDRRIALERLRSPAALRLLQRAGVTSPDALAGYYAGSLASLRPIAAGAPLNRDDLPIVEYRAPRDLVTVGSAVAAGSPIHDMLPFVVAPPEGPLFSAWTRQGWYEARARVLIEQGDLDRASTIARAAAADGFGALARRIDADAVRSVHRAEAIQEAERARVLFDSDHDVDGLRALEHAVVLDSTNARIWLWIADRRRLGRDFPGAEAGLARGRAHGDSTIQADASVIAGLVEIDRRRPLQAAERFREVQKWNPRRTDGYAFEASARVAGGDSSGAREVLRRGLQQLPEDAQLNALLMSLGDAP